MLDRKSRILVTGARGFLGRYVLDRLSAHGFNEIVPIERAACDLTRQLEVESLLNDVTPDAVIHLAAEVGGIGANRAHPGRYFYTNLMMGLNLLEASRTAKVQKFIQVGTICAYPKFTPVPFKEGDLWAGYPEETNAPYGVAKKALLVGCKAYQQEYGLNCVYLLPVNLYGPHDNFDPSTSHVIPATIKKCIDAITSKADHITAWGTGRVSREFLYVEDCAEAIVRALEKYNSPEPVNLGSGKEIELFDLVHQIAKATGFTGKILWDSTKPDGQPRRCLDTSRAEHYFDFKASTPFDIGLKKTIEWYKNAEPITYALSPSSTGAVTEA